MKKPTNYSEADLEKYLHKSVVVTYSDKDKGSDAQILRGVLEEIELSGSTENLPMRLLIRNESGDRLKISIHDIEDIREGEGE